jgi:tetratricopeptide (TPR) repeat protein
MTLRHSRVARVVFALLAIAACLFLIRATARIGFSRLLTRYAAGANSLAAADQAVQLTPTDPDAHRVRAIVLNRLHRTMEAEASLEIATRLRPLHAAQWLELGATREELGDNEGALVAFDEAVRRAPYYGETHWQRGNLLLRIGHYDQAFADLREAAASNRKLLPNAIDLAWSLTREDAKQTGALLQINNDNDRLEFARFLARRGKGNEMIEQVNLLTAPLSDQNRRELTRLAFGAGSFSEAYRLSSGSVKMEEVVNGGFEEPLSRNDDAFGWKFPSAVAKPKLAVDGSQKFEGDKSLQLSFEGDWDASAASLLSQTIVVQPGQRYRLSFAVQTKELVTGGPPRIVLTDVTNNQILAKSDAFPAATNGWQQLSVEFTLPQTSEAVAIGLVRDNCSSSPCPIFGVVWLDAFRIEKR